MSVKECEYECMRYKSCEMIFLDFIDGALNVLDSFRCIFSALHTEAWHIPFDFSYTVLHLKKKLVTEIKIIMIIIIIISASNGLALTGIH